MRTFKDTKGRTWTVAVNVATVRRVRDLLKVDLLTLGDLNDALLVKLRDPVCLCDVLYVLCRDEANAAKVSDVEFGQAMSGDVLLDGYRALMEELTDFFPEARKRLILRTLLSADQAATEKGLDVQVKVAQRISGILSGNAPGSSAWIRVRSRWRSFWTWQKRSVPTNGTARPPSS